MFDNSVVEKIVDRVVREFSPEMVIVFGSVASHTARSGSDVDLLIVMDTEEDAIMRGVRVRMALQDIIVDKDIIVVTPEEFNAKKDDEYSFISEIVRTGRVVYEA